jgi:FPC/CPF motif-containing protein YcgG
LPTYCVAFLNSSGEIHTRLRIRDLQSAVDGVADLGVPGSPPARGLDLHGLADEIVRAHGYESVNQDHQSGPIISWRDMSNMSVHATRSELPDWGMAAFHQVTGILAGDGFPCVFARQANHLKSGWVCFVDSVETESGRDTVRSAILAYIATLRCYSRTRVTIMPLMVLVKPCRPMLSLREYREQAWGLFQYLHDHDPEPWPADVPPDPDRGDWSFCFGGIQLFSNVSDPAHRIHTSRNLGDSLVFAMQPRTNFDLVGGNNKKGRQVRAEIRARVERYEGQPPAPHLGYFGTPENREWLQMATRDGEADRDFPGVCPFKHRSQRSDDKAGDGPRDEPGDEPGNG